VNAITCRDSVSLGLCSLSITSDFVLLLALALATATAAAAAAAVSLLFVVVMALGAGVQLPPSVPVGVTHSRYVRCGEGKTHAPVSSNK
jgi:hypothetical protein